jgi:hypothetical protein
MSDDTLPTPAGEGPDTSGPPDSRRPGGRTIDELLAQARVDLDRVPPDRLGTEQAAGRWSSTSAPSSNANATARFRARS